MLNKNFILEINKTIRLAIPIIIAQLGVVLMGVTDNMIVGKMLDKVALGSAGIANSIGFLVASLAVGGMSVLAPMVSKNVVEGDEHKLKGLFTNMLWVFIIYSVLLSFIGLLIFINFNYLQQAPAVNKIAPHYLLLIFISNIPLFLFLGLKQFSDGMSKPNIAMNITMLGLILNILLNIGLIGGFGILPKMGFLGSATATFITRFAMAIVLWLYLRNAKNFKSHFNQLDYKFDFSEIKKLLSRTIPAGFQIFFEIAAFSIAIIMMGWISETALAAHQIAINIASVTYMMSTGFGFAGGIRVGENWGHRSPRGIRRSGYAAYFAVFVFMVIAMLTMIFANTFLLGGFTNDVEVIKQAIPLLTIAAYFQLSDGFQVIGLGVLRGLADIKIPTLITFLAYWVIALPVGYLLGFKFNFGAVGIWYGLLLGLSISALLLYFRFRNIIKTANLKRRFQLN